MGFMLYSHNFKLPPQILDSRVGATNVDTAGPTRPRAPNLLKSVQPEQLLAILTVSLPNPATERAED
jgi:hypothetical protein